jgi:hypothetical protein
VAKSISHNALDAAFDYIAGRADTLALCHGAPVTAEEAVIPLPEGGRMLCFAPLTPGLGNGDFTIAPGVNSGRRLTVREQHGLEAMASGLADHLAVVSRSSGEVLLVTTLGEALTVEAGSAISLMSLSDEIADPV